MAELSHNGDDTSCFLTESFEGLSRQLTNLQEIKAQGYTVLYKAKRYGRWYVLKTLSEDAIRQSAYLQVLRKELEVLMLMQHPGVVQAIGMEDVAGIGPCIVMEYIDGDTLDTWLESHDTQKAEVRQQILDDLCEVLAYVHSLGVVHRDLKPENIMVTRNGQRIKLIDFGMADTDQHAVLKQPAGTPRYMAPEQAVTAAPDIRNDLYSLGIIMQQMKLGRHYQKTIARCLKPIGERYQSVAELQGDIKRFRERQLAWQKGGILLFILLMAVTLVVTLARQQSNNYETAIHPHIDSLQEQLFKERQRSQQERLLMEQQMNNSIDKLSDSLRRMAKDNEQLQQTLHRIERAKQTASTALRRKMEGTHLQAHLDTLSRWEYRWKDFSKRVVEVSRYAYQYTEDLPAEFTPQERDQIRESMLNEWQSWSNRINTKALSIRMKNVKIIPADSIAHAKNKAPSDHL